MAMTGPSPRTSSVRLNHSFMSRSYRGTHDQKPALRRGRDRPNRPWPGKRRQSAAAASASDRTVMIAVLLACAAAAFFAAGTSLQHRAASTPPELDTATPGLLRRLAGRPSWLLGIGFSGAAFCLHAAALRQRVSLNCAAGRGERHHVRRIHQSTSMAGVFGREIAIHLSHDSAQGALRPAPAPWPLCRRRR
jgi:hypothetical protein